MSHYATPFIVANLGCEMIYVIEQRLTAQNIPLDKSDKVLTDIVTVLFHPKLLDELFIPQPVATHVVIKQLLQDVSATSIMKLDDYSVSKLWDLMTMIYKWQLSVATNKNIFDITRRHLKCVANVLPHYYSRSIIEQAMSRFDSLVHRFTEDDYKCLHNTMMLWFSEYHTKISVLLRLGLQKKDGTLSLPATIDPKILENLGENIYKYDNKKNPVEEYESRCANCNEICCLLPTIEKSERGKQVVELQLPIELDKQTSAKKTLEISRITQFDNIHTNIVNRITSPEYDLTFVPEILKSTHEDLLDMLDGIDSMEDEN